MAKRKASSVETVTAPAPTVPEETVISIKGFDPNFRCRGFQFELGKTYEHDGPVVACKSGFHAIEGYPLEVLGYYAAGSRYAEVTQSGKLARHGEDSKVASAKITIGAEIHLHELIQRAVKWVFDRSTPEEGSSATGKSGAASATGYSGVALASGMEGRAMAGDGCAIFLVRRKYPDWSITHVWSGIAGRGGIKPQTWYTLGTDGQPVECA